ncbi:MAG: hypothetical protein R8G66_04000 [Cytophagales bacterium]|nr:hypothetical protein [Cytophagales bacterium]
MTLVSTVPSLQTEATANHPAETTKSFSVNQEITTQPVDSPNRTISANGQALQALFEQSLAESGENGTRKFNWVGENEIQVDGLSGMTLNNFLLKAEALGKKVTYRRSIVFQIED